MNKKIMLFGLCISILVGLIGANKTFANEFPEDSIIYQKVYHYGLYTCYTTKEDEGGLRDSTTLTKGGFDGTIGSLVTNSKKIVNTIGEINNKRDINNAHITCEELFNNKINQKFPTDSTNNDLTKKSRLTSLFYSPVGNSSGPSEDYCFSYYYQAYTEQYSIGGRNKFGGETTNHFTPKLCIKKNKNGDYESEVVNLENQYDIDPFRKGTDNAGQTPITFEKPGVNKIKVHIKQNKNKQYTLSDLGKNESEILAAIGNEIATRLGADKLNSNLSVQFIADVESGFDCGSNVWCTRRTYFALCNNFESLDNNGGIRCTNKNYPNEEIEKNNTYEHGKQSVSSEYTKTKKSSDYDTIINYFSGGQFSSRGKTKFETDDEIYQLYQWYLINVYNASISCGDTEQNGTGEGPVRLWWNEESKYTEYCYVNVEKGKEKTEVNGIRADGYFGEPMGLSTIIERLNGLKNTTPPDEFIHERNEPGQSGDIEDEDAEPVEQTCANSGAAESLGWIVCPILQFLSNATSTMYERFIEPALQVQPALFDEGQSPTFGAWQIFQGIANGLFIILLLVVIFSQLTGVGINNYGIKKILPKLMIAAVLINLSYIICVLLVDLSNIIGNSIQALFSNISVQVPDNMTIDVNGYPVSLKDSSAGTGIGMTAITGVALLAILATAIFATVETGGLGAILLALLVAAISIFSAIFFLFMLLAAREAAIVVLTVLSPIAVVCFMLPNTQKIFDKWVKFGSGLLLVYPICGLLVGGGDFVSRLLLTTNSETNFFTAFIAMIVGVIPVFFIPTVLRGSLKAAGDIGARISSVGRDATKRFGGNTEKAIRGSEAFKSTQERFNENKIRRAAGYDRKGNKRNLGRFGTLIRGGNDSVQRNSLRYQRVLAERGSMEATTGEDFLLATETANEMKTLTASGDINNMNKLGTGLQSALESNDRAKIRAYTDALSAKGEDGREQVKKAYNTAVKNGASIEAKRTFANNIMANHALDYKNNDRSMFEVAKAINLNRENDPNAEGVTTSQYLSTGGQTTLAGKVTAGNIGMMDDASFNETFGGYNKDENGNVTNPARIPDGADALQIGAAAYAALNDQNANIKVERRKALEDLIEASGYVPPARKVEVSNPSFTDTFTAKGGSGNDNFIKLQDGTWIDSNGNKMEGDFDGIVQQIRDQRDKNQS